MVFNWFQAAILLFFVGRKIEQAVDPNLLATNIDVGDYDAPKADNKAEVEGKIAALEAQANQA